MTPHPSGRHDPLGAECVCCQHAVVVTPRGRDMELSLPPGGARADQGQ